jgi:hypothetical protein
MKPRAALLVLTLACSPVAGGEAVADVAKARLGHHMFAAFQCATFAELSGDAEEHQRLFGLGITTGRTFLTAARNNEFSREEANQNVPLIVLMLLEGPSDDFILGRMFESAMRDAYDKVVIEREDGLGNLPNGEMRTGALRKIVAENRYRASNCELVR